ncbi:hypothetical protein [Treponema primitia]|uniref:glucosamine inositolphosphorylceramide transferase family protein n=1 Tax=Treponema primitia TaxID=88058 RepID=UPI000255569C|nr:hypothetical protein [Treponema primitia]
MVFKRIKQKLIRILFYEQWSLLVCNLEGTIIKPIVPPKNYIWADPFPIEYNNKTYIFVEQQIGSNNGTLGFIELYPDLTYSSFVQILEKDYHLSFPNVFTVIENDQTIWYMIPETHENKTIDLYKATNFPYAWNYEKTLMKNIEAVDSTVFYYDSYWWLFTSIGIKSYLRNKNLSLFYSDTFPSDNWIPHPQNPICSNLSNSRLAGAICLNKNTGKLNRSAQNCVKNYGTEVNINEILQLDTFSYKEKKINTILPERSSHAVCTHTVNYSKHFILRDIKTRILCPFN